MKYLFFAIGIIIICLNSYGFYVIIKDHIGPEAQHLPECIGLLGISYLLGLILALSHQIKEYKIYRGCLSLLAFSLIVICRIDHMMGHQAEWRDFIKMAIIYVFGEVLFIWISKLMDGTGNEKSQTPDISKRGKKHSTQQRIVIHHPQGVSSPKKQPKLQT